MNQASLSRLVQKEFERRYGRRATAVACAPGRINLIGEHTDYNDGFVLPLAIDRHTWVAAGSRDDRRVRVAALDVNGEEDEFDLNGVLPRHPGGGWRNYVRGVLAGLQAEGLLSRGLDLVVAGDVPQGAGLSSSASLELAVLKGALAALGLPALAPIRLALLAQQAEVDFVGCRCGIMDQLASACGVVDQALMIDCRTRAIRPVALPAGMAVLAVHSEVRRNLLDSSYNELRRACEEAAAHLGVPALRDIDLPTLEAARGELTDGVYRRARHVVTENARVLEFAGALERGDLRSMGELMAASHHSMRYDFEITVPAVDQLVALLQAALGAEGGARMTGGGFGGCVVAVLPEPMVPDVLATVHRVYRSPDGAIARAFRLRATAGADSLPLEAERDAGASTTSRP